MMRDIEMAKKVGVDGIVIGCLTPEGAVDKKNMQQLLSAAGKLSVTFHRAFDMCRNPFEALQAIEELGCHRILTSGQCATAEEGISLLKELVERSTKTIIMPGCGVNAGNIQRIALATGAHEFHLSGRITVDGQMKYRNSAVSMGGTVQVAEYGRDVTSVEKVKAAIEALI